MLSYPFRLHPCFFFFARKVTPLLSWAHAGFDRPRGGAPLPVPARAPKPHPPPTIRHHPFSSPQWILLDDPTDGERSYATAACAASCRHPHKITKPGGASGLVFLLPQVGVGQCKIPVPVLTAHGNPKIAHWFPPIPRHAHLGSLSNRLPDSGPHKYPGSGN
jgi:hypothetical protein